MSFFLERNAELYVSSVTSGWNSGNTDKIPLKAGFSYNAESVNSSVLRNSIKENRGLVGTTYSSKESIISFNFSTYITPTDSGCAERTLWQALSQTVDRYSYLEVNLLNTNTASAKEFTIWVSYQNGNTYRFDNCVITSVDIDGGINNLGSITWTGRARAITNLGNVTPAHATQTLSNYVLNKLSTINITLPSPYNSYTIPLIDSSVTISNDINFIYRTKIGDITRISGQEIVRRTVAGDFSGYLRANPKHSAELLDDLMQLSENLENVPANIVLNIGHVNSNHIEINIPKAVLDLPQYSFNDVISLRVPFVANENVKGSSDELSIKYYYQGEIFSPSSLFFNGEKGVWYDPSDMSTLWQNTAGTIPVTASGQPVARMNDKSGNGLDAYRTVTSPIFRDVGGRRWLEFNGTTDRMATVTGPAYETPHVSIFAATATRDTSLTGWRGIVELSSDFTATSNTFTLGYSGTAAYMGSRNGTIALASSTEVVNNVRNVYTGLATTSPANCQIRRNSLIRGTNTATQGTLGWYIAAPLYIGSRGTSGNASPIDFYGLIVRSGESTEVEIANAEAYLGIKAEVGLEPIFTKDPNFLTRNQFARDAWDAQVYGPQIIEDPNDGTYKMFYSAYTADGLEWGPAMATSTDLKTWTKPNIGNFDFPEDSGNFNNNLIIWHSTISPLTEPKYDLTEVIYAEGQYVALCMNQAGATTQIWSSPTGEDWTFVTNAFQGVARSPPYAEPKSIVFVDGVYRVYYAEHGIQRRSIGFYEAPTLGGTYVDQGLRPEFTSTSETLQYYDIRHWHHAGALFACVTLYDNITEVLGPNVLYRSDDGGLTYTRIGILLALGESGEWDEIMVTVAKPILVGNTWYMIYSGSAEQHNTWPRQMEMAFATDSVLLAPW